MVINDKIKEQVGNTWWPVLQKFIESEQWDGIFRHLKMRSKQVKIIPSSGEIFKSLQLCDRQKIKAVIVLQCPYATYREMNKVPVQIANGIPMDCSNTAPYMQPSLFQWWQAVEKTYGFNPDNDLRCDLSYLLEEEHVLLMNSAWTVEKDRVDSHAQLWEPFTRYLLEEVIGKLTCGIPIVLVGTQAQKYEKYLNPLCHPVLKVEHPAAASYANRDWIYGDMFRWINGIIRSNNGRGEEIQWLRKKGEPKRDNTLPAWVTEPMSKSAEELGLPWDE